MMTEKLFYTDAYMRSFDARIMECRPGKKGYEIILDRTAFYPEGGGQPGDRGVLKAGDKTIRIYDTHEKEGVILHYSEEALEPGNAVTGEIDWQYRFDLMQNHSGEHIVSGLLNRRFGYNNVGFHMGADMLTIDLDGEFTREDMRELEKCANEIVWANEKVQIVSYSEEEVKNVQYRSKKELHGTVRIVTFPGADVCACCGTHVERTGEIGLIRLISLEKFRSGMRVEMLCGRRAYEYTAAVCEQNQRISAALSAKPLQTADAVVRLKNAHAEDLYRMTGLENQVFAGIAKGYEGAGNVLHFEEGLSADGVRRLAVEVMEVCQGRCAVFSGDDGQGYKYAIGEKNGDLRDLVKAMNAKLNGRGGGKPFFAQGSSAASREEIEEFFRTE